MSYSTLCLAVWRLGTRLRLLLVTVIFVRGESNGRLFDPDKVGRTRRSTN